MALWSTISARSAAGRSTSSAACQTAAQASIACGSSASDIRRASASSAGRSAGAAAGFSARSGDGRGRRGRPAGRGNAPRGPHAQRQPVHQRSLVHARADVLADVRRAVAQVEARGQGKGLLARVDGEFAGGPVALGRPGDRLVGHTHGGQPVHEEGHGGQEVHPAARLPGVREVRGALREQLQAARLVAGQRAELDVVRVRAPHALHGPHQPEAPQMMRAGLVEAAQAQQRAQGGRQDAVRLVGARELALQDRPPQVAAPRRPRPARPATSPGCAVRRRGSRPCCRGRRPARRRTPVRPAAGRRHARPR